MKCFCMVAEVLILKSHNSVISVQSKYKNIPYKRWINEPGHSYWPCLLSWETKSLIFVEVVAPDTNMSLKVTGCKTYVSFCHMHGLADNEDKWTAIAVSETATYITHRQQRSTKDTVTNSNTRWLRATSETDTGYNSITWQQIQSYFD
jgi:hypothetical protein